MTYFSSKIEKMGKMRSFRMKRLSTPLFKMAGNMLNFIFGQLYSFTVSSFLQFWGFTDL